jgi:hypothetical protein
MSDWQKWMFSTVFLSTWHTLEPTNFSGEILFINSGASLWSEIPGHEFSQWPYGVYIGKDKAKDFTVIVSNRAMRGNNRYDHSQSAQSKLPLQSCRTRAQIAQRAGISQKMRLLILSYARSHCRVGES